MADDTEAVGRYTYQPKPRTKAQNKYFYLDGKLYRMDGQDKAKNIMRAWDFEDKKVVAFVLSDVKRRMKNAYDTAEVARMLNRSRVSIQTYVIQGRINSPKRIYQKGANTYGKPFEMMKWSDDDILALHTFLLNHPAGRPRKDKSLAKAAPRIPSRKELLAILRNQPMFYMMTSSGEFVPVWSSYDSV